MKTLFTALLVLSTNLNAADYSWQNHGNLYNDPLMHHLPRTKTIIPQLGGGYRVKEGAGFTHYSAPDAFGRVRVYKQGITTPSGNW